MVNPDHCGYTAKHLVELDARRGGTWSARGRRLGQLMGVVLVTVGLGWLAWHATTVGFQSATPALPTELGRVERIELQMEALRGSFNTLLAESLESRLRELRAKVEAGRVGPEDIRAFEQLNKDLSLLKSRAADEPDNRLDFDPPEHARFAAVPGQSAADPVLALLAEVRILIYLTLLVLCATTLYGVGNWLRQRQLAARLPSVENLPLLTSQSDSRPD